MNYSRVIAEFEEWLKSDDGKRALAEAAERKSTRPVSPTILWCWIVGAVLGILWKLLLWAQP